LFFSIKKYKYNRLVYNFKSKGLKDLNMKNKSIFFNKEDKALIIKSYLEGESADKIAKIFGCSNAPIFRVLRENNIKINNKGYQKGHKGYIIKWSDKHLEYLKEINLGKKNPWFGGSLSLERCIAKNLKIREKAKNNPNWGMRNKIHKESTKKLMSENSGAVKYMKGKTYVEIYGKEKAVEHLKKKSISMKKFIKEHPDNFFTIVGKNEKQILDELQDMIGFSIKRQFFINGYYLDGYCQELNLAIEVDEWGHYINGELRECDKIRQEEIILALNCKFLRIKESDYLKNKLIEVIINEK